MGMCQKMTNVNEELRIVHFGGSWGGITWGEMLDIGDGEEGSKPHCHVCIYTTILHVPHMDPKT